MPTRSFAITADDKPVTLKGAGAGEIAITVTNSTARPIRGLAKVVPLGKTKQEWLEVAGDVERSFSANEAHQFIVRVNIPAGTPAGKYSCRLNMASVQNPDDDFTEGPAVAVEVAKAPEPVAPTPGRPKWLFWVILAVLAVGGATAVVVMMLPSKPEEKPQPQQPQVVKVPGGIEGATMTSAVQRLVASGLQIGEVVKASTSEQAKWDRIKSITPASDTEVDPGTQVKLEVWGEPTRDLSVLKAHVLELQREQIMKARPMRVVPNPK